MPENRFVVCLFFKKARTSNFPHVLKTSQTLGSLWDFKSQEKMRGWTYLTFGK